MINNGTGASERLCSASSGEQLWEYSGLVGSEGRREKEWEVRLTEG